jgi:hypothetical protein
MMNLKNYIIPTTVCNKKLVTEMMASCVMGSKGSEQGWKNTLHYVLSLS